MSISCFHFPTTTTQCSEPEVVSRPVHNRSFDLLIFWFPSIFGSLASFGTLSGAYHASSGLLLFQLVASSPLFARLLVLPPGRLSSPFYLRSCSFFSVSFSVLRSRHPRPSFPSLLVSPACPSLGTRSPVAMAPCLVFSLLFWVLPFAVHTSSLLWSLCRFHGPCAVLV